MCIKMHVEFYTPFESFIIAGSTIRRKCVVFFVSYFLCLRTLNSSPKTLHEYLFIWDFIFLCEKFKKVHTTCRSINFWIVHFNLLKSEYFTSIVKNVSVIICVTYPSFFIYLNGNLRSQII